MSWKNWPSWLKGGVIGGSILVFLLLLSVLDTPAPELILGILLIPSLSIGFGVGALIGFIIGKIKSQRKRK